MITSFQKICVLLVVLGSTADALHKVNSLASTSLSSPSSSSERATDVVELRGGAQTTRRVKLPKIEVTTEGASLPSHVFNLVKGIVGVGVLSLPAGIAAFGDAPSAVLPATGLITLIGILSAFGFFLIGKVCAYTGATSYRDAWGKSVGESTSWIPAASCTIKTMLACLAFSMVLKDTFAALLGTARNPTLLVLTVAVLLPLCLLKNLSALAPFSLAGVLGMGYTAVAMALRYFDGSYQLPDGSLVADVAENLRPAFGSNSNVFSSNSLILVCMLSTAFMAHFNAPKFYLELKENTLQRFNSVVSFSFGISILLMSGITMLGFLTFGKSCSGLVLNNYSTKDLLMSGSRIAVAISLVFSYPLAFTGCRDGFMDILNIPSDKRTPSVQNIITIALLTVFTSGAMVLKDVSFVLAFGGATLGNLLTYVYPAIMYRAIVQEQGRTEENGAVLASVMSAVLGIVMGLIGTKMALQNIA